MSDVGKKTVDALQRFTEDLEAGRGLEGRRAARVERLADGRFKIVERDAQGNVTTRVVDDPEG